MAKRIRSFLTHLHPPQVCRRTLRPRATLGLGIASLTTLGVLLATGATLFLYYVPDQDKAYERILHITTTLHYGGFVRNLHYVAANTLVILVIAHLVRVFLTAAYKERKCNWIYGLTLLALVLLSNFTGYLLPWDQVSYWAIKVGSSLAGYLPFVGKEIQMFMLGGQQIGPETLLRSFALHAGFVPLLLVTFTGLHLWRIRKDGGLACAPDEAEEKLPADPWLYRAEAAIALSVLAVLIILALNLEAPIYERADPTHPPNPAKAPWYFIGFQEMVSYSAFWGGVMAPVVIGGLLLLAPWLDRSTSCGGQWFTRDRFRFNLAFLLILLSQAVFIIIGQWFRGANWTLTIGF
jgi:quinol-cytochrome oxidoreductase complex cytochrome b subunit